MKKLTFYFSLLLSLSIRLAAQTTYSVGTSSFDFPTLKEAFDYLNLGAASGDIILEIVDNTIETETAVLYSSGGGINYTSVLIYPVAAGFSITGDVAGPLIDLSGAENVILDGRVNKGGAADLVISNINTGTSASTIRFIESANTNKIQYCHIKGSATNTSGGIVLFSTSSTGSGNDGNVIDNNFITCEGTNRPVNAIFSLGSSGSENNGNIISNNNIFNFLNPGTESRGIFISSFNTAWTISGNSFYETTSFSPSASVSYYVIQINNTSGTGFTVTGNFIGGSASSCGGSAWTKTNAFNNPFSAIYLSTGTTVASSLQNNTIANFNWSNSSNASWTGIHAAEGAINIGNITGNTVGASSGTGSVVITGGANNSDIFGINISSSGNVICRNNIIGSVTAANSNTAFATNFSGINKTSSAGSSTISNNSIGSVSTANSIQLINGSTGNPQNLFGIISSATGATTISGNTVSNLLNNCTFNSPAGGQVIGIAARNGSNTVSGNVINNLSTAAPNQGLNDAASVIGISQTSTLPGQIISGNTINDLSNTYNGTDPVMIIGLNYAGGTGGTNSVEKNFIHSLSQSSSSTLSTVCGIMITEGKTLYSNNIISLGSGLLNGHIITGIFEKGASGNDNTLYFNTIYIGGSPTSGISNSYALYSDVNTNIRNFRDNILNNARSNNGSTGNHYAVYFNYTDNTNLTLDYNDYYAPGTGGVLGYFSGNKTALPIVTGQDVASLSIDPLFTAAGGTTPTSYMPNEGTLVSGISTSVLTDYNSVPRGSTPAMGAFEIGGCTNPANGGSVAADQTACSPFDPLAFTSTASPTGFIGVLEYKWQQSTTSSSSGFSDIPSSNSLTYDPGTLTQTTWFKRIARVNCKSDWTGAAESNVIMITVNPLPVANPITGSNAVCMGDALNLTSNATGTPVLTYIWSSSNTNVATVNNSGHVTTVNPGSTNITYKVTDGSSTSCEATSPVHIVTVNPLPIANPISGANTVCVNSTISLTPNATGTPALTYTWSSSNTTRATVNNSGVVTGQSAGSAVIRYTVYDGSSTACSAISAAFPVTINPLPVAGNITGANAVCMGDSLSLASNASGTAPLTITWASSNTAVATVNSSGIVKSVSAGTTDITYTVTDGSTTSCSVTSAPFTVTVNALPVAGAITGAGGVCMGSTLDLTSNATGTLPLTYSWYSSDTLVAKVDNSGMVTTVMPGNTGITYIVTDGSSTSCKATSPVKTISVNALPVAGAITGADAVCMGSTLSLTPNATGTLPLTYSWASSNTGIATVNNSGVVSPVAAGSAEITYTVTDGSNSACQATSPEYSVTVNPSPEINLVVGGSTTICSGTGASITVDLSLATTTYQLRNAAGNINIGNAVTGTGGTISLPTGNLTSSSTLNVLATIIITGCSAQLTETEIITVDPVSVGGTVTGENSSIPIGSSTGIMTLSGQTGTVVKWQKVFGSGSWEDISNTMTTYTDTPGSIGNWQYRTMVKSGVCPEANSAPFTIEVFTTTHRDVMNLFTPNGDAYNEYWELPKMSEWGKCDVKVYNRWGKLVYSNKNYDNLWNGTSDGEALPEGPYYYIITTQNAGTIKGTVNIVR